MRRLRSFKTQTSTGDAKTRKRPSAVYKAKIDAGAVRSPDAALPAPKPDAALPKVRIKLQSKPSRASVYLGRRKLGTTPMTLTRAQANRSVRLTLRRADYRPVSFSVSLKRSQTVSKTLKPIIELLPQ